MKSNLLNIVGTSSFNYINNYIDLDSPNTLVVNTTNPFNIESNNTAINAIVNLRPVNEFRFINKFFEAVNEKLNAGGIFICRFETIVARKERQKIGNIPIIKNLYFIFGFLFLRVAPKVWGLKKIYFFITKGKIRLLSKAEVLGRLVSCGFKIVDYSSFNGYLYCVVKKEKLPDFNPEPSYGPLFKMKRMGKNGKIIKVYKFRTMHPYSEYLQDHILTLHGYAESGKPKNDFRLTPWGATLRKFWIDELPQLINVIKGEMKLVGVRPISERYFNDIPKDLQELRSKQKPGCIPPYVSLDRKGSVEEVLQSEREYLLIKNKNPYTTDTKFFFKALFNIIVKRKRSA
jgi:lipopolysaccharide/colanic/teichoic acid biosynthesis glycosyltransferase